MKIEEKKDMCIAVYYIIEEKKNNIIYSQQYIILLLTHYFIHSKHQPYVKLPVANFAIVAKDG